MRKFRTPVIDVKKYGGKQVALYKGKIVASGEGTVEVLQKAKKRVPETHWRDIALLSVPTTINLIY